MDMVFISGWMGPFIGEIGTEIHRMALESSSGKMGGAMWGISVVVNFTDTDFISTRMGRNIEVSFSKIRKRGMESIRGRMVRNFLVTGKMDR